MHLLRAAPLFSIKPLIPVEKPKFDHPESKGMKTGIDFNTME